MSETVFDDAVALLGARVVWVGQGQGKVLLSRRPIRGAYMSFPLYVIDRHGQDRLTAIVHPLAPSGYIVETVESLPWPSDSNGNMSEVGLPYFFYEMVPDGYLGSHFGRYFSKLLQVAPRPADWADDDILYVLSRRGLDLPGNIVLGDSAMARWQKSVLDPHVVPEARVLGHYGEQVASVSRADKEGTPVKPTGVVGGVQPKFTALRVLAGEAAHVIVKHTKTTGTPFCQRWSDLLVCEHLALTAVQEHLGVAASLSRVLQDETHTFLELERFDRKGQAGRLPVCSWATLNNGIIGTDDTQWPRAMKRLYDCNLLDGSEIHKVISIWVFGKLISNTDMHNGNIALMPSQGKLAIAPVYDMLPMAYAPRGEVLPPREYSVLPCPPGLENLWRKAAKAAGWFWLNASRDSRISESFREICSQNLQILKHAVKGEPSA